MMEWIVNIFIIIFVFASVFISSNKFVDVSVLPKWNVYFVIGSMGAMIIALFLKNFRFRINILDVLFYVFVIYILLRSLTYPIDLRFLGITSCILIYFVCKVVDAKHKDFIELVFVCSIKIKQSNKLAGLSCDRGILPYSPVSFFYLITCTTFLSIINFTSLVRSIKLNK